MINKYLFYSLRPKQWIKNFFIFLPLVFGKKLFLYPENLNCLIAFILFSMASSASYLINDIYDCAKDKHHPTKRLRPLASGKMNLKTAWISGIILGAISLALSFLMNKSFGIVVAAYLLLNFLYTIKLKKLVIIDIFCIGAFFLLRIIAGGIVAEVSLSHWIIFMTVLIALFLGFNKRRQEIQNLGRKKKLHRGVLLEYDTYFIDQMVSVITSSVVIVYMLYTVDKRTVNEFGTQHLIYTIPFVYYGIFRYLYMIHKVRKEGDPTRLLLHDKTMQVNLVLWIIVCISIIYFGL